MSRIDKDGKIQTLVRVKKIVPEAKQQQLKVALKRLSYEMKQLVRREMRPDQVTKLTISYPVQTEDDFLKNDWYINQTFGFYGNMSKDDLSFLNVFFGEEGKKFLPLAGVATRLGSGSQLTSRAYSFLPLPIETGLPAHINGHFAIHSSRRSIWQQTSFGQWNRVMKKHVIAPAYCHFLVDQGATLTSLSEVKNWIQLLPNMTTARDDFFASFSVDVYQHMIDCCLRTVPVPNGQSIKFESATNCLFCTSSRNELVEGVLLALDRKICVYPEVGLRFKKAQIDSITFLSPQVILDTLISASLKLPAPVASTPFKDGSTVNVVLQYILQGPIASDYSKLNGAPLCLTADGQLRRFDLDTQVFVDSGFDSLMPDHKHLFLHELVSQLFNRVNSRGPIRQLTFDDVGKILPQRSDYMDRKWSSLLWKLIKVHTLIVTYS